MASGLQNRRGSLGIGGTGTPESDSAVPESDNAVLNGEIDLPTVQPRHSLPSAFAQLELRRSAWPEEVL